MRRGLMVASLLVLCGVVATSAMPRLRLLGARPDVFLLFALVAVATVPRDRALVLAWAAGLAKDVFSTGPLGAHAFLFLVLGVAALAVRQYAYAEAPATLFLLTGAASAVSQTVYAVVTFLWFPHVAIGPLLTQIPLQALYTAVLAPIVYLIVARLLSRPWAGRRRIRLS